MTKSSMPLRLSAMAAPIPANPAPTMTALKCSEVMVRRYLRYRARPAPQSALQRSGALVLGGGDAHDGAVTLAPRLGGGIEDEHPDRGVLHRLGRVGLQLGGALVLPVADRRLAGVGAVGHGQHRVGLAGVWLTAIGLRDHPDQRGVGNLGQA